MARKQLLTTAEKLSIEFLRECFEYRDGVLYWRERPSAHFQRPADHATFIKKFAGKPAGRRGRDGYVNIGLRVDGKAISMARHRVVWALHHDAWPSLQIDHENRRPGEDSIENLREATLAQNLSNSTRRRVHPYVGPHRFGGYQAQVKVGDKQVHIGIFDTEAEAEAHRHLVNAALEGLARSLAKKSKTGRKRKGHQTEAPADADDPFTVDKPCVCGAYGGPQSHAKWCRYAADYDAGIGHE